MFFFFQGEGGKRCLIGFRGVGGVVKGEGGGVPELYSCLFDIVAPSNNELTSDIFLLLIFSTHHKYRFRLKMRLQCFGTTISM